MLIALYSEAEQVLMGGGTNYLDYRKSTLPLVLHYGVWTFEMVYDMDPNLKALSIS